MLDLFEDAVHLILFIFGICAAIFLVYFGIRMWIYNVNNAVEENNKAGVWGFFAFGVFIVSWIVLEINDIL